MMLKPLLLVLTAWAAAAEDAALNGIEDASRDRRGVIEEEKFYNNRVDSQPWLPGPLPPEDPTTKVSSLGETERYVQTTERPTDRPTGRGARASNENWVKLPFPTRDEAERDSLTPPQPSNDLLDSRMPRIDFVTQNKNLDAAESRADPSKGVSRARSDDSRSDFVRPDEEERQLKPVYPRQALYYPEESRRYYEDRYQPADPYRRGRYDGYERRYYPLPYPRIDEYDSTIPRKPKRVIYYAHLPEVVRTPPGADLRQRYGPRRYEDDYSTRAGRYDYRFRSRYPYAPFHKEARFRDLAGAGTVAKEKKEEKATAAPAVKQETPPRMFRNTINSHQYHEAGPEPKGYQDVVTHDDAYLRPLGPAEPLFQRAVYDPYRPYFRYETRGL